MIRRPPRSTPLYSSAASDVYKRQPLKALKIPSVPRLRAVPHYLSGKKPSFLSRATMNASRTTCVRKKSWNPPLPVNPFARCAVRCGLLDAIRRNSQSAQPAKKSTRVLSLVKIIRITATNNRSFAPESEEYVPASPSWGRKHILYFWAQTDFASGKIIARTLADVSRHGGRIYNLCFCRSLCTPVSYTHLTLPTNREV